MSLSQLRARGGSGPWLFISTTQREHARVNNRAQMRCHGLAPDAKRVVRAGGEQQLAVAVEDDRLRPAPRAPHPPRAHQDTTRTRKGPLVLLPSLAWASRLLKPHGRPSKAWVPRLPKDLPKGPSAFRRTFRKVLRRWTFRKVLRRCVGPSKRSFSLAGDLPKRSFGVAWDRSFSPARDLPNIGPTQGPRIGFEALLKEDPPKQAPGPGTATAPNEKPPRAQKRQDRR